MSKTNDLKKLIRSKLTGITGVKGVYFRNAQEGSVYPHVVFNFPSTNLGDLNRSDFVVEIHVWNRGTDTTVAARIADDIEDVLWCQNLPQTSILPTFYAEGRQEVEDEDKEIQHIVIQYSVQLYERN